MTRRLLPTVRIAWSALVLIASASIALAPGLCRAQQKQLIESKQYFDAGAAAYAAGDYEAAIQAFEAAYRLTPLPGIAFSLAQAERRQYFVSHEPVHLERAIELFRAYLADAQTGGRRADATDALAQLEPLALALQRGAASEAAAADADLAKQTRLLVRCEAPGAQISLDGAAPVPSPLIVEAGAGPHHIRVEAPGFFPEQRQATAVDGEIVPIEVSLRERPATVIVDGAEGAEIEMYVDGALASGAGASRRLELRAGRHWLAFARKGHRLQTMELELRRGETRRVTARLGWTAQRTASVALFAIGGGTLATGLLLTALALDRENAAQELVERRESASLDPAQRAEYDDAVEARGRLRVAAAASLAASAGCLLAGLLLYQLDDVSPQDVAPPPRTPGSTQGPGLAVVPGAGSVSVRVDLRGTF